MYDQLKIADKAAKTQQFFDRAMATNKTDPATVTPTPNGLIKQGTPRTWLRRRRCWPMLARRIRAISIC